MVKSKTWCLNRLNYDGIDKIFYLNEGDTMVGRNKSADISLTSKISSRNHCVINLSNDDTITIRNQSSNGTYVNEMKMESETHVVKHGDVIGLGCNQSVFEFKLKHEWPDYYIFQLQDTRLVNYENDVIDLVSDEEEERDIKPLVVNGEIQKVANVAEQSIPTNSDMLAENVSLNEMSNHDDHEDNELIYSQQILMDIKQEVNFPDDSQIENHDDDFSILIASDDSDDDANGDPEDGSRWSQRLSQNQDMVVKKVTESVQNNKRKMAKQIEAIPLLLPKKSRRNSVSASAYTKPVASDSVTKAVSDVTSDVNVGAITSKSIRENENQELFVDRFDPFASKQKIVEKPTTFEDALKQITFKPIKTRIAHVPKHQNQIGELKSILRQPNDDWPSDGKKKVKRVHFATERPVVREYTPDRGDVGAIVANNMDSLNSFENDPLHNIITDITEWKTDWINQKNSTPPINGVNLVINPLTYKYASFDVYKNNVTSLLKHELWSSIQAENRNRNRFEVKINTMDLVKRADRKRYVFHVQVVAEGANPRANVGDFVLVEADNSSKFFAYVTIQRFTMSGYSKTTYLTMEASESVVKLKNGESTKMYITPIANIRTELKLFNSVFYLDRTPFKNLILDPDTYHEPDVPSRVPKFSYSGYDKLNDEQMNILKSIYNKCLGNGGDISLSLIEGPPGTGKTRLIVSIILQLLFGSEMKRKLRILVLTASNAAVDIIARRLMHIRDKLAGNEKQKFLNIVRYGVMNSMHPDVRRITPQNLKNNTPLSPSQCDLQTRTLLSEQTRLKGQIDMLSKAKNTTTTVLHDKLKDHQKRLNIINETLAKKGTDQCNQSDGIDEVMKNARVVCSTLSSAINLKQYIKKFDVCFIDEASQCTEPWTLVPLQYNVTSMILVGDSNQLSPVVLSQVCRDNNLERSLFTRLYDTISKNGPMAKSTYAMTLQYRMHPDICHFSNQYFYQNRLTSVAPSTDNFMLRPYSIFNLNCLQSNKYDNIHYYNMDEAKFIVSMLKVMVKHAEPKEFSYGIITPYAKQRQEIQNLLGTSSTLSAFNIPVNTIDSYQGQERDIIILCTTRTTGIGFLANPQRLNVALTRAKKCLVICGNFTSISNTSVWEKLIADAKRRHKFHDIPTDYDFQTIADVLVCKKQKQR